MPVRALIIAIENYPSGWPSSPLEGTNAAALKFYEWARDQKKISTENIFCCWELATGTNIYGTTRKEILTACDALVEAGQNRTEELFIFYSGHGAGLEGTSTQDPTDLLIASDVLPRRFRGEAYLSLSELQAFLKHFLGPGEHFYFIDSCRTTAPADELSYSGLGASARIGIVKQRAELHSLYSTAPGFSADTRSGFAAALLEGLHGRGRKVWRGDELWVKFRTVARYVKKVVKKRAPDQQVAAKFGETYGWLLRLDPPYEKRCSIFVGNAAKDDTFTLILTTERTGPEAFAFRGPTITRLLNRVLKKWS